MRVVIILSSVPHYFAARISAFQRISPDLSVLSAKGFGDFAEFVAEEQLAELPITQLDANGKIGQQIESHLSELSPDVVVIAGWATPECFSGLSWARKNRKRVVVMSASHSEDAVRSPVREFLKARIVQCCDAALVAGPRQRDYIKTLGMPIELVSLGYDAVDNFHFQQGAEMARSSRSAERKRLGLPQRYLLASARFIPKKNLSRLIEGYSKSIKRLSEFPDLVILGDGPERPAVEASIATNGVSGRVHLLGFQAYDLLPAFYGLAEGFVHVSTTEQWGLVINEAAAAGLPLVVSEPCGAAPELVCDGLNGWTVDPLDVDDMSNALCRLMALSPEERSVMGGASRRIVANWGPERFAEGLAAACNAAMAQRPRRLSLWDAFLVRLLSSREIKSVA